MFLRSGSLRLHVPRSLGFARLELRDVKGAYLELLKVLLSYFSSRPVDLLASRNVEKIKTISKLIPEFGRAKLKHIIQHVLWYLQ